jgi:hypothetical protein
MFCVGDVVTVVSGKIGFVPSKSAVVAMDIWRRRWRRQVCLRIG